MITITKCFIVLNRKFTLKSASIYKKSYKIFNFQFSVFITLNIYANN